MSFLDFLGRGRGRRLRRRNLPRSFVPALELLESRTLLSAGSLLVPTFSPVPGSTMGGSNTEAVFEFGSDVRISWPLLSGTTGFDLLIYDVAAGREVVSESNWPDPAYEPVSLTGAVRYQVFVRARFGNNQISDWSHPTYFTLTAGQNQQPLGIAQFIGLNGDTPPSLTWTPDNNVTVQSYEVLIYNVAAGQEVLRQTGIGPTNFSPATLLGSGDEFQAFVRSRSVSGDFSDWSAPFHFHGMGPSQILPAPTFTSPQIVWQDTGAASYDVLIYNVSTGQEVLHATELTTTAYTPTSLLSLPDDYQAFIRARDANGDFGIWSSPLNFHLDAIL